jgi:hypothetical protein
MKPKTYITKRKGNNTYCELFGDSKRFIVSGETGPKFDNYQNTRTWENKVINYVPKEWAKIGNVRKCFHGTRKQNIQYIASQSLLPGGGKYRKRWGSGMFGRGIYVAPKPEKAWNFAWADKDGRRYLLQGRVALGKTFKPEQVGDFKQWIQETHYGSIVAEPDKEIKGLRTSSGTLRHTEYCVYNPIQVVIDYVYEYEIIDKDKAKSKMSTMTYFRSLLREKPVDGKAPWDTIEKSKIHPCWKEGSLCKNAYNVSGCMSKRKKHGVTKDEFEFCRRYEK